MPTCLAYSQVSIPLDPPPPIPLPLVGQSQPASSDPSIPIVPIAAGNPHRESKVPHCPRAQGPMRRSYCDIEKSTKQRRRGSAIKVHARGHVFSRLQAAVLGSQRLGIRRRKLRMEVRMGVLLRLQLYFEIGELRLIGSFRGMADRQGRMVGRDTYERMWGVWRREDGVWLWRCI